MLFGKSISYRIQKWVDAYPADTLESCSGTKNEHKYTPNNVINVEIITLDMKVYRLSYHANTVSNIFLIMFD